MSIFLSYRCQNHKGIITIAHAGAALEYSVVLRLQSVCTHLVISIVRLLYIRILLFKLRDEILETISITINSDEDTDNEEPDDNANL